MQDVTQAAATGHVSADEEAPPERDEPLPIDLLAGPLAALEQAEAALYEAKQRLEEEEERVYIARRVLANAATEPELAHYVYWQMPEVHAEWLVAPLGVWCVHALLDAIGPLHETGIPCNACCQDILAASRTALARLDQEHEPLCGGCQARRAAARESEWTRHIAAREARVIELRALPYGDYLRTPEWGQTRKGALRRARYRCQACNTSDPLDVHHRTYERLGAERNDDLIALCRGCHSLFHRKGALA